MRFLPMLLALLAVCAFGGAVISLRDVLSMWHTGRVLAFAVLAVMLLTASRRMRRAHLRDRPRSAVTARSAVAGGLIFCASMMTIWAGVLTLFEALEICNHEYLHWLPRNQPKVFPVPAGWAAAIMGIVGTLFLATGLFMFSFLFFRRSHVRGLESPVAPLSSGTDPNPNPYRAPQQAN